MHSSTAAGGWHDWSCGNRSQNGGSAWSGPYPSAESGLNVGCADAAGGTNSSGSGSGMGCCSWTGACVDTGIEDVTEEIGVGLLVDVALLVGVAVVPVAGPAGSGEPVQPASSATVAMIGKKCFMMLSFRRRLESVESCLTRVGFAAHTVAVLVMLGEVDTVAAVHLMPNIGA